MGRKIIRSIAPLRLGIAGGSSDLPDFVKKYGGLVLNATINKYVYATLLPRSDSKISIKSHDYNIIVNGNTHRKMPYDGNLDLVKATINKIENLAEKDITGFDIIISSDAPPGAGLGTSSTVVVSILGLFREWLDLHLNDYQLARLAWEIERQDMQLAGGLQDQWASVMGGFNFMEFHRDGTVIINPLRIKDWVKRELQHNMLLVYTGLTHSSADLIKDQAKSSKENMLYRQHIKNAAIAAKEALLTEDLSNFGQILSLEWTYKKQLSNKITNEVIDKMEAKAIELGAEGLKITGAGGGGLMIIYADWCKKKSIADALREFGCQPWDFSWEPKGVFTWTIKS